MKSSFKAKRKTGQGMMSVNRTQRGKKFLELAIWEVFAEGKAA